ncbi:hypothetical protein [Pseudomonas sp. TUM22785]|uniref:hypothetical protein n=1 Tax=Pseudomonas sp. TUM22785 TaxID=3019098 RepID=UPI0023068A31|nr:hypothetical protein [Pseudomonas sp. TUM22785]WCD82149.1 hypothetical protein PI990_09065 [Pseudomonas sp. TUM22785]
MPETQLYFPNINRAVVLYQDQFGGTDLLLNRLEGWLINKGVIVVDESCLQQGDNIDLLLLPTSRMDSIYTLSRQGINYSKVLVWAMGYGAFEAAFYSPRAKSYLFSLSTIPIRSLQYFFLKELLEHNSLVFTDVAGMDYDLRSVQLSSLASAKLIAPIAVKSHNFIPTLQGCKKRLRVGWVGRISADFKIYPLIKLLDDLQELVVFKRLEIESITIVGDGDAEWLLRDYLKTYKKISIKWIASILPDSIGQFIFDEMDVLFAMGTSALDGARFSTPTVIVKPFSKVEQRSDISYRWIYESQGYSLGELPDSKSSLEQPSKNLEAIFKELSLMGPSEIGSRCYSYSTTFFEDNAFELLLDRDLRSVSRRVIYYSKFLFLLNTVKMLVKRIIKLGMS